VKNFDDIKRFQELARKRIDEIRCKKIDVSDPHVMESLELTELSLDIMCNLSEVLFEKESNDMAKHLDPSHKYQRTFADLLEEIEEHKRHNS